MKTIYTEVRNEHQQENTVYIDAWKTADENEEGETVAKVNLETKEVFYLNVVAEFDVKVQEAINKVLSPLK